MRMQRRKQKCGVYAGSFDPLTIGHMWMIEQGAGLFDRLTVAVGVNPDKRYTFPLEDRLKMLRDALSEHYSNPGSDTTRRFRRIGGTAGRGLPGIATIVHIGPGIGANTH